MAETTETTIDAANIRTHVRVLLDCAEFRASRRNTDFLTYVIERHLDGKDDLINGYEIGLAVFERGEDFDPQTDPIVRTQAVRLRNALKRYYYEEGAETELRITLPRGTYVPRIERQTDMAEAAPTKPSRRPLNPTIAVLPFLDLSPDRDQGLLAMGIAEELSLSLTAFEGFSVISSQSSQLFKAQSGDIREVGRSLGASFILQGTIRRSDVRLRIIAEVLDCTTGAVLWSERFDRDVTAQNLFDIQDEITSDVVSKVADHYGVIPRKLSEVSAGRRTEDLSSYEALLTAYAYTNTGDPALHKKAIQLLEATIKRDPKYAPAWAHLSELTTDAYVLWCDWDDTLLDKSLHAAEQATLLDPNYQYAHFAKAYTHFFRDEAPDFWEAAEETLKLNPQSAFVTGFIGFLIAMSGDWTRGLDVVERSKHLNPFHPGWFYLASVIHALTEGRIEDAYREAKKMRTPSIPWDPLMRATCLSMLERPEEAAHALEELIDVQPKLADAANRARYMQFFVRNKGTANKSLKALDKILTVAPGGPNGAT